MTMASKDYSKYDDHQLIAAILDNNNEVIDYFFNVKCSGLFAYILDNVFSKRIDKRELTQELYLYLANNDWHKVRQFDFRSKLMTWVSVVAIRFFQKKRETLIETASNITLNDKMWKENIAGTSIEEKMDLHFALQKMSNTRYRTVIECLDLKDVSPEALAKQMNIKVDNLYNIHRRALMQLRLIMGRKEEYYD